MWKFYNIRLIEDLYLIIESKSADGMAVNKPNI